MRLHLVISWGLFLALATTVGCSKGTATVTGRVTYQDQPVTSGSVVFYGEDGRVDSGLLDADGKYTIARAPVGVVKVAVIASKETKTRSKGPQPGPPLGKGKTKKSSGEQPQQALETTELKSTIPERYNDPNKSGLVYTVNSGKQVINIDLKP
jgi:hypothetical protein